MSPSSTTRRSSAAVANKVLRSAAATRCSSASSSTRANRLWFCCMITSRMSSSSCRRSEAPARRRKISLSNCAKRFSNCSFNSSRSCTLFVAASVESLKEFNSCLAVVKSELDASARAVRNCNASRSTDMSASRHRLTSASCLCNSSTLTMLERRSTANAARDSRSRASASFAAFLRSASRSSASAAVAAGRATLASPRSAARSSSTTCVFRSMTFRAFSRR
mmetsp:Transcript_39406/g.104492  ORF Transcript_39406/g.104492 Transcript_39406/m.104492 type:complete len:222 (+) Transcript_39406:474-1139(+)